ncbi:phosphotransferase family protein [Nocardioides sp. LHD-245]|uniref:phosphotransferase family protein n=1 Tax=Nocardioides sp. LHD-245 TaxID=3051387 RepID=UPI0027E067C1|nr:phosphotransferase family protein [Nocardioides sp. LHD-245]
MASSDTSEGPIAPEGALDGAALAGYLAAAGVELAGELRSSLLVGGRSNPTYALSDGSREWILRRPPHGHVLQSAHDMAREVRVVTALAGTPVPVPHVVAHCEDPAVLGAPFYVMDRLEGRTFRTREDTAVLAETDRAALAGALVDTLVALHDVDPAQVGLQGWGRPDGYLQRQLARWARQWEAVKTSERPEVGVLVERLAATMPVSRFPGIVHGDYKVDNVMVGLDDPARVVGVLDWELSTLGDTLSDLGLLVSFWDEVGRPFNPITAGATAHPGFPTADEIVESYARQRGIGVDDLDWYVVFADVKIAVVLEQIHARHLRGDTLGDGFDDIGDMVAPLLERALDRCSRASDAALRGVG